MLFLLSNNTSVHLEASSHGYNPQFEVNRYRGGRPSLAASLQLTERDANFALSEDVQIDDVR